MTNIEYVKEQIETINEDLEQNKRLKYFPSIFIDRKLLDRYESILNHLEMLEDIRYIVLTFDEYSGVDASLILKNIRRVLKKHEE
ncbi:MAG: hypothetical protein J6T10_07295 [Methanobrevibacter sp.]|nr:hypothetical protein [Methanobrevibacter sp.]